MTEAEGWLDRAAKAHTGAVDADAEAQAQRAERRYAILRASRAGARYDEITARLGCARQLVRQDIYLARKEHPEYAERLSTHGADRC